MFYWLPAHWNPRAVFHTLRQGRTVAILERPWEWHCLSCGKGNSHA